MLGRRGAHRLRLWSEEVTLVAYGVGGMTIEVNTERYLLRVRVKGSLTDLLWPG